MDFFSLLVRYFPYPFTTIIHSTCSKYNAHLINHHFCIWKSNHPFFIILGKLVKWVFSKTCCLFRALGSPPAFLYCCLLPFSSSCLQTVSVSFHWCSGWIVILPTLLSASLITLPSSGALPSQGGPAAGAEGFMPFSPRAEQWSLEMKQGKLSHLTVFLSRKHSNSAINIHHWKWQNAMLMVCLR